MIGLLFTLALAASGPGDGATRASVEPDYSRQSVDQLIDDLTAIDAETPGAASLADYDSFIAVDSVATPTVMVLGAPAPKIPPAMRELVRRGPGALGQLIFHVNDKRPTHLTVGDSPILMNRSFMQEYQTRDGRFENGPPCSGDACSKAAFFGERIDGVYTITVGDLCYTLIGQIVNRRLVAARYQPSGNFFVNSPIHSPWLANQVFGDWVNTDALGLEASLIRDVELARDQYDAERALVRLRFYFPDAYKGLSGVALERKNAFEAKPPAQSRR